MLRCAGVWIRINAATTKKETKRWSAKKKKLVLRGLKYIMYRCVCVCVWTGCFAWIAVDCVTTMECNFRRSLCYSPANFQAQRNVFVYIRAWLFMEMMNVDLNGCAYVLIVWLVSHTSLCLLTEPLWVLTGRHNTLFIRGKIPNWPFGCDDR